MGDLIKRQDAQKAIVDTRLDTNGYAGMAIARIPAVDAVEVVRCKECIYHKRPLKCPMCNSMPYKDPFGRHLLLTQDKTTNEGFCSYGAKMEE